MLDMQLIQTRGFRNTVQNGQVVGFQFNVRLTYYRGIFLSQLRPQKVVVDGEVFPRESVIWEFDGKEYTFAQMRREGNVHWCPETPATLKIRKPGGLSQGYHEITTGYRFSSSYIPPVLQRTIDTDEPDPIYEILGFGQQHDTRRLLLV